MHQFIHLSAPSSGLTPWYVKSIGTITGKASGQLRIILCKQHLLCFLFMKMICMFQGVNLQRATSIITTCQPCRLTCQQLRSCSFSSDRRRVSRLAYYQKMGSIRPRHGDGLFSSQKRWSRKMSTFDQLSDQKSAAPLAIPERRTKRPPSQYPPAADIQRFHIAAGSKRSQKMH